MRRVKGHSGGGVMGGGNPCNPKIRVICDSDKRMTAEPRGVFCADRSIICVLYASADEPSDFKNAFVQLGDGHAIRAGRRARVVDQNIDFAKMPDRGSGYEGE